MFFQTYVVPVCLFEREGNTAIIKRTIGTAFFINDEGVFITAKHAIQGSLNILKNTSNSFIGLNVKANEGKSPANLFLRQNRL